MKERKPIKLNPKAPDTLAQYTDQVSPKVEKIDRPLIQLILQLSSLLEYHFTENTASDKSYQETVLFTINLFYYLSILGRAKILCTDKTLLPTENSSNDPVYTFLLELYISRLVRGEFGGDTLLRQFFNLGSFDIDKPSSQTEIYLTLTEIFKSLSNDAEEVQSAKGIFWRTLYHKIMNQILQIQPEIDRNSRKPVSDFIKYQLNLLNKLKTENPNDETTITTITELLSIYNNPSGLLQKSLKPADLLYLSVLRLPEAIQSSDQELRQSATTFFSELIQKHIDDKKSEAVTKQPNLTEEQLHTLVESYYEYFANFLTYLYLTLHSFDIRSLLITLRQSNISHVQKAGSHLEKLISRGYLKVPLSLQGLYDLEFIRKTEEGESSYPEFMTPEEYYATIRINLIEEYQLASFPSTLKELMVLVDSLPEDKRQLVLDQTDYFSGVEQILDEFLINVDSYITYGQIVQDKKNKNNLSGYFTIHFDRVIFGEDDEDDEDDVTEPETDLIALTVNFRLTNGKFEFELPYFRDELNSELSTQLKTLYEVVKNMCTKLVIYQQAILYLPNCPQKPPKLQGNSKAVSRPRSPKKKNSPDSEADDNLEVGELQNDSTKPKFKVILHNTLSRGTDGQQLDDENLNKTFNDFREKYENGKIRSFQLSEVRHEGLPVFRAVLGKNRVLYQEDKNTKSCIVYRIKNRSSVYRYRR